MLPYVKQEQQADERLQDCRPRSGRRLIQPPDTASEAYFDYYVGLYIGQFRPIADLSCWQKHVSLYHVLGPMFCAIVTSDNDFFRKCYETL